MLVHFDAVGLFQLFCLVQGLTTAGYLLGNQGKAAGNGWLGLLVGALTLQVADYFLSRSGIYYRHKELYFSPLFYSWAFGPLLWGYVRTRYAPTAGLRAWHFGPVLVQALFYGVLTLQAFETKTWFWLTVHKPVTRYVEHYGTVASLAAYVWASARLVQRHERQPRWLWRFLLGLGAFCGLVALDPLINAAYLPAGAPKFYLSGLVLPVFAYGLALRTWLAEPATRGSGAGATVPAESLAALPPVVLEAVAPRPPADPALVARVVAAFEIDQLYKDPDLTLDGLARHVGLLPNTVSHLLNGGLAQSFNEVVNGYRLEEVKRRLLTADADRYTVLALALDAGFNSKTTFNRIFKEKTGLTPKDYRKTSHPTQRDDALSAIG
jgi:AraC-like DNA-binding protein